MTDAPKPTADEVMGSITGYDEIAISRAFKTDIGDMREKGFTFLRALVFVHQRRQGKKDAEAYQHAMELPMRALTEDYFEPEPDDLDPDDPDTPAGKDSA